MKRGIKLNFNNHLLKTATLRMLRKTKKKKINRYQQQFVFA